MSRRAHDPALDGDTTTPVLPVTAPLPAAPGPEDWRALARSAPWRWTTMTAVLREYPSPRRAAMGAEPGEVRLHLRRGLGAPRVESLDGTLLQAEYHAAAEIEDMAVLPGEQVGRWANRNAGRSVAFFGWGEDFDAAAEVARMHDEELAALLHPQVRPDGLIAQRPDHVPDPPMWQSYIHVALLDPAELADGRDEDGSTGRPGTEVSDVRAVTLDGRTVWTARVRPTAWYEPRCGCCALMTTHAVAVAEWGAEAAADLGWPGPEADLSHASVALDVATGIVVRLRIHGGAEDADRYEIDIERAD